MEQAERGIVIAIGRNEWSLENVLPIGAIAKFSKYTEEIHFDDEGGRPVRHPVREGYSRVAQCLRLSGADVRNPIRTGSLALSA